MVVILVGLGVVWGPWRGVRIKEIASFQTGHGTVYALCLLPGDDVLLTGGKGGTIEFRSLPDGQVLRTLSGHTSLISALTLSANGKTLYSGDLRGDVKVWDLKTGKVTRELSVGTDVIHALAVNPEETALAAKDRDGTVQLWDLQQGGALSSLTRPDWHSSDLSMSSDGRLLAFSIMFHLERQGISIWELNPLRETKTLPPEEYAHRLVHFLDGTHTLVTDGELGTLELWDVDRRVQTGTLKAPIRASWSALAHTAEGSLLAAGADQGWLALWDLASNERIDSFRAHKPTITAMTFSKDGTRLITGCHDYGWDDRPGHAEIKVWEIRR